MARMMVGAPGASFGLLGGAALGAGLMWLLDPAVGRRHRARIRDRADHLKHEVGDAVGKSARDVAHRTRGLAAQARARRERWEPVEDAVLLARVRSRLGRAVSHAHAIDVIAKNGEVEISGPVLAGEAFRLLRAVRRTPGVAHVRDNLERYAEPGSHPSLQGSPARRPGGQLARDRWPPALRILFGTVGGGLAAWGFGGKRAGRSGAAAAGTFLLVRALTNLPVRRLVGIGAGTRAIDVQKDVHVSAPVSEVFALWRNLEGLPRFMHHIRSVTVSGDRSRWEARGPVGLPIEWTARITKLVENELIAWESEEGSLLRTAGLVRFHDDGAGGTTVQVRLTYNPPGGAIGHAIAALFGADPKHALDDDLVRFKELVERRRTAPTQAGALA